MLSSRPAAVLATTFARLSRCSLRQIQRAGPPNRVVKIRAMAAEKAAPGSIEPYASTYSRRRGNKSKEPADGIANPVPDAEGTTKEGDGDVSAEMESLRKESGRLNNMTVKELRADEIDAFPGDAVIFFRELNLLRGLSSSLNVWIVYQEIMRPFAEATLHGSLAPGPVGNSNWINNSKVHSQVESKLRKHLLDMGRDGILGIQVCACKVGKVIIKQLQVFLVDMILDLFNLIVCFLFSPRRKGLLQACCIGWWIMEKTKLDEIVSNIWPEISNSGKDTIKAHHILDHTFGLHNAMSVVRSDPMLIADWD